MFHKDGKKPPATEAEPPAEPVADTTSETASDTPASPDPATTDAPQTGEPPEGAASEAEPTDETPAEEPPQEAPKSEAEVLKDRLLRLQADFDNYRKRVARDHQDLVSQAGADVLASMLAPMDALELAIATMEKSAPEDDPFLKGVRMVRDQFLAAFARHSLEPIPTKVGDELDPQREEALGLMPAPGIEENHIAVVVRKGYTLHGKVLRAAQVMVGAGAPAAEPTTDSQEA